MKRFMLIAFSIFITFLIASCDDNKENNNNENVEEQCEADSTKCEGNIFMACMPSDNESSLSWITVANCDENEKDCDDNEGCVEKFICNQNERQCNNTTVQICKNNSWEDLKDCVDKEETCSDGGCRNETTESFGNPYGEVFVDFTSNYIAIIDPNDPSTATPYKAYVPAFAEGSIGNNFDITPDDAYSISSIAFYQKEQNVSIFQYIFYKSEESAESTTSSSDVSFIVFLSLDITNDFPTEFPAKIKLDPMDTNAIATFEIINLESEPNCIHAVGEGELTITEATNITVGGEGSSLSIYGKLTLYSPANYKGFADISSELDITEFCEAK